MKIITSISADEYLSWFQKAMSDDGVWPFLSMQPRYLPIKIEDDDWDRRVIMDDAGLGVCVIDFDRTGSHAVGLCIWVLSCEARPMVAGSLMRSAIDVAARYDVRWIKTGVHESNASSVRVNEKFFGAPWGIEPNAAWNGQLRRYEGRVYYKAEADQVVRRIGGAL